MFDTSHEFQTWPFNTCESTLDLVYIFRECDRCLWWLTCNRLIFVLSCLLFFYLSVKIGLRGMALAFDQTDRAVVAAYTAYAYAIAVAVSTSRSYAAFVAATTAAESAVLIVAEGHRNHIPSERKFQRAEDAIRRAAESAVAVDAGNTPTGSWPFDTCDSA